MSSPFNEQKYNSLLEGLEVTEIKYSEYQKTYRLRLDSEYYLKQFLLNEKYLTSNVKILELCYLNVLNIKNLSLNKDFNYLEISDVKSNNIDYSYDKIDYKEIPDRATYVLRNNDVVISTVRPNRNSVALIQDAKRLVGTSGFTVLRANKRKIFPEYLYAFCKTKYFVTKLMRENTATMYPAVSDYDIFNMKIPVLSDDFQKQICIKIISSLQCIERSQSLQHQAEELLLETIGLKGFKPSEKGTNIKTFKKSFLTTGRLDAEYYQPKYEKIENKIKQYKDGFSCIGEQFEQNKITIDHSEKLYNYIEIGDINVENGSYIPNIIDVFELPANAKIKSKYGDLLISKVRPNRGAVSIIDKIIPNLVVSGAFTVLEEKSNYKKEVLFVLLRTFYYKEWLLKFNVGTSYPVIKDEDVLTLPIPLIENKIQQEIVNMIAESFSLRRKSEKLLDEAKEMVEREIEKG